MQWECTTNIALTAPVQGGFSLPVEGEGAGGWRGTGLCMMAAVFLILSAAFGLTADEHPPPYGPRLAHWTQAPVLWEVEGFDWRQVRRISTYIEKVSAGGYSRSICDAKAERIAYAVYTASLDYDIDPVLLLSLISTESTFDERAVSPKGAVGLMQLMPGTGRYVAGELDIPGDSVFTDPGCNIRGGAFYFRELLDRFGGHLPTALAAYNCGPTDIAARRECGDFEPENFGYVRKVLFRNYVAFRDFGDWGG